MQFRGQLKQRLALLHGAADSAAPGERLTAAGADSSVTAGHIVAACGDSVLAVCAIDAEEFHVDGDPERVFQR